MIHLAVSYRTWTEAQWIDLTTNRVDSGSRSTTATTGTADDRTPEAQNEFTYAEYSQHRFNPGRYLHKIHNIRWL